MVTGWSLWFFCHNLLRSAQRRVSPVAQQAQHGEVSGSISALGPSWAPGLSFEFSIVAVGANWAPLELLPDLCEISAMLRCRLVQLLKSQTFEETRGNHSIRCTRCTTRYYAKICQIYILNVTQEESSAIHFSEFSLLLPEYLPFCPCFLTSERPSCCCMFSVSKQNLHSPARTIDLPKKQSRASCAVVP